MKNEKLAFDKVNYILLAVAMVIVIIGFILMSGSGTTIDHFDADIFSFRRIKVAPLISLAGFLMMIYAVMRKPKDNK